MPKLLFCLSVGRGDVINSLCSVLFFGVESWPTAHGCYRLHCWVTVAESRGVKGGGGHKPFQ